jgi:PhzF family phenazine biosynthesis protein
MRETAARLGHETAFVLPPQAGGDVRLRYFVPLHEMEMCVHATVAAVVVLGRNGQLCRSPAAVETPLGLVGVDWDADASTAMVEQFPPRFDDELVDQRDRVLQALRLPPESLALEVGPIQAVSTARAKLMVPLHDEESLDALEPDLRLIWDVCENWTSPASTPSPEQRPEPTPPPDSFRVVPAMPRTRPSGWQPVPSARTSPPIARLTGLPAGTSGRSPRAAR